MVMSNDKDLTSEGVESDRSEFLALPYWMSRSRCSLYKYWFGNWNGSWEGSRLVDNRCRWRKRFVDDRCRFVDNRSRFVDNRCRSRLVCRCGFCMVVIRTGLSFIPHISNETRITINTVGNNLCTAIRESNRVFAMGLISITVFIMLESLWFISFLVVDIVAKSIQGSYIRVIITISWGRGGVVGKSDGSKGAPRAN